MAPLPSSKVAKGAAMLLLAALQDERVRAQLGKVPDAARAWTSANGAIERRLSALHRHADAVFPDPDDPAGAAVHRRIGELSRATEISSTMPIIERRRAHTRIRAEMTRLELVLVDTVLPSGQLPPGQQA
jgi:hypothetical protein